MLSDGDSKYYTYEAIDSAPQEMAHGVAVDIFRVEYNTANRHYAHIDCPSHEDYVKVICFTSVCNVESGLLKVVQTNLSHRSSIFSDLFRHFIDN